MKKRFLSTSVIGLSVVLSACGGMGGAPANTPSTPKLTAVTSFSGVLKEPGQEPGTFVAWSKGVVTVKAVAYSTPSINGTFAVSTDSDAKGAFTIQLPDDATVQPLLAVFPYNGEAAPQDCTSTLKSSVATMKTVVIPFVQLSSATLNGGAEPIEFTSFDFTKRTATGNYGTIIYADVAGHLSGTQNCSYTLPDGTMQKTTQTYNADVVKGWNLLGGDLSLTATSTSVTYKNGNFPTQWVASVSAMPTPAPAQSLSMSKLNTLFKGNAQK